MPSFKPTHIIRITHEGSTEEVPVMLVDGVAYTEGEWDSGTAADWEVVDGEWLFQGQAPACREYEVTSIA